MIGVDYMALPKPKSRREMYLAKIAGENVNTPSGKTREEKYLEHIAENGGVVHQIKDADAREAAEMLFQKNDALYKGRDLTKVFVAEITNFANEWEWIKNRIYNANYIGIHVGDYIPLTINGETHEIQIAGIDTYTKTTDYNIGHHIDFISRDCYGPTVQWNVENNNNGNAESPYPYLVSNVHTFLETLYETLPAAVKNVISNKRFLLDQRYSAEGVLTDSTSWGWVDMGKLWIPTEYEVFGSVIWATKGFGQGQAVQYPIFANNWNNRIKGAGPNGGRCAWWLASVKSGDSMNACNVSSSGTAGHWIASDAYRVPVCFRITA